MTSLSSVTVRRGFTPLPILPTVVNVARFSGRGLSIHQPRKHQREIPVRQGFEHLGIAQHFGRVGVGHGSVVGGYAHALYVGPRSTCNATCNSFQIHQFR